MHLTIEQKVKQNFQQAVKERKGSKLIYKHTHFAMK